jgi:hypothetical protein
LSNIPPLQPDVPAEDSLLFKQIALNVWLIATTITLFITNVRVMADEYSGTVVQRHEIQPSSYTAVQATDLNYDYWQTITRGFQQIHAQ